MSDNMIDMHPLVSVLVVLYRKFDNVYLAIDSVFSQTYDNIELIVTDDGSPSFPNQGISDYIKGHKRDNIVNVQILDNKVNVGTVKHLNHAFERASGSIIKCLAGDDVLFDEFVIDRIVKRFVEKPFNLLSTSSISFNTEGSFFRFYPHVETGERMKAKLKDAKSQYTAFSRWKYHDLASGSTMVYNAEFWKRMGGFDEEYILWEDGPFMYAISKAGYRIDMAFDIISIKYSQGGVSSNGNQILADDVRRFIKKSLEEGSKSSVIQKRYLRFVYWQNYAKSKFHRLITYLVFPDIYIDYKLYWLKEHMRGRKDIKYYKQIINKN